MKKKIIKYDADFPPEVRDDMNGLIQVLNLQDDPEKNLGIIRQFWTERKATNSFYPIFPFLTPEVIAFLGNTSSKKLDLERLSKRIFNSGKFSFWQWIFKHRDLLPQKMLFNIWYQCFDYRLFSKTIMLEMPDGIKISYSHSKKFPYDLPLSDPLLLDNVYVQQHISRNKKKGWKFLRYINGRGWKTPQMVSEMLRNAVKEDDPASFLIMMDMQNIPVTFGFVMMVIKARAWNILELLLQNNMIPGAELPMEELCCHAVSRLSDADGLKVLSAVEKFFPGTVKNTRDDFGRNLLWYLIQNQNTGWFHPDCKLAAFLLKNGCDAENANTLGLSWRFITESMSLHQKITQMERRYRQGGNSLRVQTLWRLN